MNPRVLSLAVSAVVAFKRLFVGIKIKIVYGHGARMSAAPISQRQSHVQN
jgi:hypothetical protein